MYDLTVILSTEFCGFYYLLCSVCDFSVVCAGLLVSLLIFSIQLSSIKV